MVLFGYTVLLLGCLVAVVGEVMLLTVAYKAGLAWFFGCLFIPAVALVFLFVHFRAAARPLGILAMGLLLAVVGVWALGGDSYYGE